MCGNRKKHINHPQFDVWILGIRWLYPYCVIHPRWVEKCCQTAVRIKTCLDLGAYWGLRRRKRPLRRKRRVQWVATGWNISADGYCWELYIWVNYNDLTATSLESWLVREIIPKWPQDSGWWNIIICPDIYPQMWFLMISISMPPPSFERYWYFRKYKLRNCANP